MKVRLNKSTVERALTMKNCLKYQYAANLGVTKDYFVACLAGRAYPSAKLRARIQSDLGEPWDRLFEVVEDKEG